MTESRMKPESRQEAHDRLAALSEAERRGAAAASEGQLVAPSAPLVDPDGEEEDTFQRRLRDGEVENPRLVPATSDTVTQQTGAAPKKASADGEGSKEARKSSSRGARKRSKG